MEDLEVAETISYKNFEILIVPDLEPKNPRKGIKLGTMLCKHSRWRLGDDESNSMTSEEIESFATRRDVISLPLYLLDHGGLWMQTCRFKEDPQGFDTSFVGWIVVEKKKAREFLKVKRLSAKLRMKVRQLLEKEVEQYNSYLSGDCYGFIIKTKDGFEMKSQYGFYSYEECIETAKKEVDILSRTCGQPYLFPYLNKMGGKNANQVKF